MSYTLCLSLSNFLDREFFFDYDFPSIGPPDYAVNSDLKKKFEILMNSKRSLVTELVDMPARKCFELEREIPKKVRLEGLMHGFLTTRALQAKYKDSVIWDSFRLSRPGIAKEELQPFDLIEIDEHNLINISYFYFLNKDEKKTLLDSVKIRYLADIESLAQKIGGELGSFNAVHIRLGDFFAAYGADGYSIDIERVRKYLEANLTDCKLPLLIATDGLQEKELFATLLKDYKYLFIDELIFDEYRKEFVGLEFTDFNVLSILNQLLCAASESFIGTCRSTFTVIIHRLRQERYGKKDFNFLPDDRMAKVLSPDYKIVPDNQGFFEWNRYSIFNDDPHSVGWLREWNYDLTSLGF